MPFVNFAIATLDDGIASDATSCDLTQGHGARFDDGEATNTFTAVIYDTYYGDIAEAYHNSAAEVVTAVYTSGSDRLTLTRAQESTTARDFNSAGRTYKIKQIISAAFLNAL